MISKLKKSRLGRYLSKYKIKFHFFKEAYNFYFSLVRYNASIDTFKSVGKIKYSLLKENHTIEKGLSMRNPRIGFGKERVTQLLQDLIKFHSLYNDCEFLNYPLATIRKYIEHSKTNKVEIDLIETLYDSLCKSSLCKFGEIVVGAGVKEVKKEELLQYSRVDFEGFVNSRHSIRYFSSEKPSIDLINNALRLAQRTPSACNRQSWFSHIFYNDEMTQELLSWQGGARGFEKDIPVTILVTANLNAFLMHESHQAYVDGGMYAMSLMYSLHSQGLGTVPLSTGFKIEKIKLLYSKFNIPKNEVPIVIIGIGCLLDKFNVAFSTRKPIEETTVYNF